MTEQQAENARIVMLDHRRSMRADLAATIVSGMVQRDALMLEDRVVEIKVANALRIADAILQECAK